MKCLAGHEESEREAVKAQEKWDRGAHVQARPCGAEAGFLAGEGRRSAPGCVGQTLTQSQARRSRCKRELRVGRCFVNSNSVSSLN